MESEFDTNDELKVLEREKFNTVGKIGKPGEKIQCVVGVNMLSEGWDARTVTNILGLRAFTSQLLCEQVIGRGLRRSETKDTVKVFDLADDFTKVSNKYYTLKHFIERIKIYNEEDFDYNMEKVIL